MEAIFEYLSLYEPDFDAAAHAIYNWDPTAPEAYVELYQLPDGTITSLPMNSDVTPVTLPSFYPVPVSELVGELAPKLATNAKLIAERYINTFLNHSWQIALLNAKQNAMAILNNTAAVEQAITDGKISGTLDEVLTNVKNILNNIKDIEMWMKNVHAVPVAFEGQMNAIVSDVQNGVKTPEEALAEMAGLYKNLPAQIEGVVRPAAVTLLSPQDIGYIETIFEIVAPYITQ